jgi:hypothetical protein
MQSVESHPTFRGNMSPTCYLRHAGFLLYSFLTLKMEATCSSETSVNFQQTTQCYIPEGRTLHNRKIFKSHLPFPVL